MTFGFRFLIYFHKFISFAAFPEPNLKSCADFCWNSNFLGTKCVVKLNWQKGQFQWSGPHKIKMGWMWLAMQNEFDISDLCSWSTVVSKNPLQVCTRSTALIWRPLSLYFLCSVLGGCLASSCFCFLWNCKCLIQRKCFFFLLNIKAP